VWTEVEPEIKLSEGSNGMGDKSNGRPNGLRDEIEREMRSAVKGERDGTDEIERQMRVGEIWQIKSQGQIHGR
jgi:hypothetical protein